MKNTDLYNAISDINPEYLEGINESNTQKKHLSKKAFIAILCAVVGVVALVKVASILYTAYFTTPFFLLTFIKK